nr:uncharacterized protein LOC116651929 isoform X1 [Drosophila virilis]
MSSRKHVVYAWITYILAFCGIAGFYFDIHTGRVIKSRVLSYYGRFFSLLILVITPMTIYTYAINTPLNLTQNKLMNLLIATYPSVMLASIVSCMFCVQRWQHRIIKLIEDLLRMEELSIEPNYSVTPSQQPYLRRLFWIKLCLVIQRLVILFVYYIFAQDKDTIFNLTVSLFRIMRCGFYFLMFNIIWQISLTFLKLQLYLEQLLFDIMPMAKKINKILKGQRMYYRLIRMINELCTIFKYPLFFYLIYLVYIYGLSGYTLIQMLFGKKLYIWLPTMKLLHILITIIEAMEFYILVRIAHMANTLHEHTFYILRYPYLNSDLVEKSVSKYLHLCLIFLSLDYFRMNGFPSS